jgi:hypothetical protein
MDHYVEYKKPRAEVGKLSRKISRENSKKFVKSVKHDITGPQRRGFRVFKNLQATENV